MKTHPAQPDAAPSLDSKSFAASWIAAGIALVMTVASLLAAALI